MFLYRNANKIICDNQMKVIVFIKLAHDKLVTSKTSFTTNTQPMYTKTGNSEVYKSKNCESSDSRI